LMSVTFDEFKASLIDKNVNLKKRKALSI